MVQSLKVLYALMLMLFAVSCSHKPNNDAHSNNDVVGKWVCAVDNGESIGCDTIIFADNSCYTDNQGILYKSTDSGFDFQARFCVNVSGMWSLQGDSIYVKHCFDTFRFLYDKNSFMVRANGANADTLALKSIKEEMSNNLEEYLQKSYEETYKAIAGRTVCIGKIAFVSVDSLIIVKDDVSLCLRRVQ